MLAVMVYLAAVTVAPTNQVVQVEQTQVVVAERQTMKAQTQTELAAQVSSLCAT
jgi:hypothetical protein